MARAQREILVEATTPDGEPLTLTAEDGEHVVRVRGQTLMSSRCSGSEQVMATLACAQGVPMDNARILVGGLGLGFTLRAVLDQAGTTTRITVVELLALVVDWNRGPLGSCAGRPLDDPRVSVHVGDLLDYLAVGGHGFDAILLDIDNGPEAFTVRSNERLYHPPGLALLRRALRAGGVLVVWSAFRSRAFEQRLRQAGFEARSVTTRARAAVGKGRRHTLFVAY
ncbi:MAG: spermidine synthase [Gammaproteobacteria bacterium]